MIGNIKYKCVVELFSDHARISNTNVNSIVNDRVEVELGKAINMLKRAEGMFVIISSRRFECEEKDMEEISKKNMVLSLSDLSGTLEFE